MFFYLCFIAHTTLLLTSAVFIQPVLFLALSPIYEKAKKHLTLFKDTALPQTRKAIGSFHLLLIIANMIISLLICLPLSHLYVFSPSIAF